MCAIHSGNNFATTADRTIYFSENYKDFTDIETATVSNSVFSAEGKLYWYSNGTLKTYDGEMVDLYPNGLAGFTDKFDIINNKIYYISSSGKGNNLFVLTCDENSGVWNAPIQITNQTRDIDYFTVGNVDGQTIAVITIREYTITETIFEDICDLAYVILEDKHDIKLEYVNYEHSHVVPLSKLPLTIGILNNGSVELDEINISVFDSSNNLVYENIHQIELNPGAFDELVIEMPLGEEINLSDYRVVVNEVNCEDVDYNNNEKEVKIGYCNFDVTAEPIIVNDVRYAVINVTNKSYTKSAGILRIYSPADAETPVDVVTIEELAYGDSMIYQLPIDSRTLNGNDGVITIKASSNVEQYNSYNCKEELYFGSLMSSKNNCSCICHKQGIWEIIWKILIVFYKLFSTNSSCVCDSMHW